MNEEFTQNALAHGEAGQQWLDSIPSLIRKYEKEWSLKVLPPFDLNYNYVAPVLLSDGSEAVLKIAFPGDKEFQSEIQALTLFNGRAVANILRAEPKDAVALIEKVQPGTPLSSLADDDEATRILARLIKRIRQPLPANHNFITIADWSSAISKFRQIFPTSNSLIPSHLLAKAEKLFETLIASSEPPVLLHGDLHHDNVLASQGGEWLAIDPKGIAAEPSNEVAAMIRNPYEKLKNIADLEPLLRRRLLILSQELELEAQRLQDWCFAQTVLSAVWNVEGAKGPEHAVRVAEALINLK